MTLLKDRGERKHAVLHRIAMGRPGNPMATGRERYFHSLDHFEITGVSQDPKTEQFLVDVDAMKRLASFGDSDRYKNRRRVPIRVDSNNIEDFFKQEYQSRAKLPILNADGSQRMWPGRSYKDDSGAWKKEADTPASMVKCWCRGDGETARRLYGDQTEKIIACRANKRTLPHRTPAELADILSKKAKHLPEDGKLCPYMQNDNAKAGPVCKPETVLICRSDVVNNLGSFCKFRSAGHVTTDILYDSLVDIHRALGGQLEHVPLDLVLTMKPIMYQGASKLQPVASVELRTSLEATYSYVNELLRSRGAMLTAAQEYKALLPAAFEEAEEQRNVELSAVVDNQKPGGNIPEVLPPEK